MSMIVGDAVIIYIILKDELNVFNNKEMRKSA